MSKLDGEKLNKQGKIILGMVCVPMIMIMFFIFSHLQLERDYLQRERGRLQREIVEENKTNARYIKFIGE